MGRQFHALEQPFASGCSRRQQHTLAGTGIRIRQLHFVSAAPEHLTPVDQNLCLGRHIVEKHRRCQHHQVRSPDQAVNPGLHLVLDGAEPLFFTHHQFPAGLDLQSIQGQGFGSGPPVPARVKKPVQQIDGISIFPGASLQSEHKHGGLLS